MRALTCIGVRTILCFDPTISYAQTGPGSDPLETMPFRFGPLGVNPTLAITNFGVDDNIFDDSTDPKSDFTMTVAPRLQARLRSGNLLFSGSAATGLVYYQKFDDQRSVDYATDGRMDVDSWLAAPLCAGIVSRHARTAQCRNRCACSTHTNHRSRR